MLLFKWNVTRSSTNLILLEFLNAIVFH